MREEYHVTLYSQMGPREGRLDRTAVSTLFCETALELHGERLTGVTTADVCRMRWEGSRISPEP